MRIVLIKLGFQFWDKSKRIYHPWVTRFDRVEGKVFFVEERYWKTYRVVDAKLDNLKIALDVNDNNKSEFSESDGKDEQVFYKVVISISCYLFQEF